MDRLANRKEIGKLLSQGYKHKDIAEELDVSPSVVAKVARELGLCTRKNTQYVVISEGDWLMLLDSLTKGVSITEASKAYGVSRAAIYARIHK